MELKRDATPFLAAAAATRSCVDLPGTQLKVGDAKTFGGVNLTTPEACRAWCQAHSSESQCRCRKVRLPVTCACCWCIADASKRALWHGA